MQNLQIPVYFLLIIFSIKNLKEYLMDFTKFLLKRSSTFYKRTALVLSFLIMFLEALYVVVLINAIVFSFFHLFNLFEYKAY